MPRLSVAVCTNREIKVGVSLTPWIKGMPALGALCLYVVLVVSHQVPTRTTHGGKLIEGHGG